MNFSELETLVAEGLEKRCVPGVAVSLIEGGGVESTHCWGVRSSETAEPVEGETIFEAASMGKALVGYVTLRLVEERVLDLDRPLATYLNSRHVADPRIDLVTARHALSHQTGLWRDSSEAPPYFERDPARGFKYSNEGIYYLQLALEEITGATLESLAQRLMWEPLDMRDSSFIWRHDYEVKTALPHDETGKALEKWRPGTPKGPTSLHTSAPDFARVVAALLNRPARHGVLGGDRIAEMLSPQVEVHEVWGAGPPDPGSFWGLGWGLQLIDPGSFWHWGWNDGFLSFAVGWPGENRGLVAFTNGMNGLWVCKDLVTWFSGVAHPAFRWLEHE